VKTGNVAYSQKQNDIFGSIIDIIYLYYIYYEYEKEMKPRFWRLLKYLVWEIKAHWNETDKGIWEFRGEPMHFTYSKMMCYVGMDRAVRIANYYGRENLASRWARLMDKIKEDILKNGWNEKAKAFTMFYGSEELDASALKMAYHEFLPPDDPRLISTVKQIYKKLRKGALVQRYKIVDDFGKSNSAFIICSFWMIDALYYIGEKKKAEQMFSRLLKYSNQLGLFSEDIDTRTGKLAGNFPQGYTHLALINSAILLSEWSSKRKKLDHTAIFRGKHLF
jgi:GH15 family glucan-1,4-alpha-glucosidase